MEASLRFYTDVFGMERLPSPNFAQHVEWLRLGDQQLHLFHRETAAPEFHHIALDVDDFEAAYLKAKELGLLDEDSFGAAVRELPGGAVQMYIRDPARNHGLCPRLGVVLGAEYELRARDPQSGQLSHHAAERPDVGCPHVHRRERLLPHLRPDARCEHGARLLPASGRLHRLRDAAIDD